MKEDFGSVSVRGSLVSVLTSGFGISNLGLSSFDVSVLGFALKRDGCGELELSEEYGGMILRLGGIDFRRLLADRGRFCADTRFTRSSISSSPSSMRSGPEYFSKELFEP